MALWSYIFIVPVPFPYLDYKLIEDKKNNI